MKLEILVLLMVVSIAVRVVSCAAAEGIDLVKNGRPVVDIVVPDQMNAVEKWAAEDLALYLGKMSGAKFAPVRESDYQGTGDRFAIYVGKTERGQALLAEAGELEPDEFIMAGGTDSGQLVIVGRDEPYDPDAKQRKWKYQATSLPGVSVLTSMGTCRGVWHFLREYCGVRWYLPGEVGEVVPATATLALPGSLHVRKAPSFGMRIMSGVRLDGTTEEFTKWHFRVGFGAPGRFPWANHTHASYGRGALKKGHPEFFAMYDGKREVRTTAPIRLCHNAPGLPEMIADQVVSYMQGQDFSPGSCNAVMPCDGYRGRQICECPLCIEDKREGQRREQADQSSQRPFHCQNYASHYVWPLVVKVAELVKDRIPQYYVTCCAYAFYGMPPEQPEGFPDNVGVQICKERLLYMTTEKRDCDRQRIEAWVRKCKFLSVWEYYEFHQWANPIPLICPHYIADDLQFLVGKVTGEQVTCHQMYEYTILEGGHLAMDGLNIYVTARFLEDASQDIDQVLADYYRLFYGPAAEAMRVFYEDLERKWRENPEAGRREDKYDLGFARLCMQRLEDARRKVPDDSKYAERIDMLIFDYQPWLTLLEQKAHPPTYKCVAVADAPRLDGVLDEACWSAAQEMPFYLTAGFKERGGFPDSLASRCRMVHTTEAIYLGVRVGSEAQPDKQSERFEVTFCSPAGERYVLNVDGKGQAMGSHYLVPEGDDKEAWPVQAEVADARRPGEWILEVKVPLADLGMDSVATGWRINVTIDSHRLVRSPRILAEPLVPRRPYLLTWQPEAKGFAYNPKYYGTIQFE